MNNRAESHGPIHSRRRPQALAPVPCRTWRSQGQGKDNAWSHPGGQRHPSKPTWPQAGFLSASSVLPQGPSAACCAGEERGGEEAKPHDLTRALHRGTHTQKTTERGRERGSTPWAERGSKETHQTTMAGRRTWRGLIFLRGGKNRGRRPFLPQVGTRTLEGGDQSPNQLLEASATRLEMHLRRGGGRGGGGGRRKGRWASP